MKLKLALITLPVFIGVIAYFTYQEITSRKSLEVPAEKKQAESTVTTSENLPPVITEEVVEYSNENSEDAADVEIWDEESDTEPDNSTVIDDSYLEITKEDCTSRCTNFSQDAEDFKYCQEVCGLSKPNSNNCKAPIDLEKDYCLKDQAIAKNDPKICDQIIDSNIRSSCRLRIIEEDLEQMTPKDSNNLPY